MSFIHYELVGHFDPENPVEFGYPARPKSLRPIDPLIVDRVLKSLEFRIDHMVSVTEEGYVYCEWTADLSIPKNVVDQFLKRVADEAGAVVMGQLLNVWYPEAAKTKYEASYEERWRKWEQVRGKQPPRQPESPLAQYFRPTPPGPCPHCGRRLRTSRAKQCRFCKMDWHDPANVFRRA